MSIARIGAVGYKSESKTVEIALYIIARKRLQRTHHRAVAHIHARKPRNAGASHQIEYKSLYPVFAVVPHGEGLRSFAEAAL